MKKSLTRREFVQTTAAATAAVAIIPVVGCTKSPYDPKGLPTRKLGNTGVEVPLLGFGCGSRWMAVENDEEALGILEYAIDHGLYYWDTAANYENEQIPSEERVGKLLKDRRKEVFLVSKVRVREADKAKESIERSLKRLQTDYIDLMHVHSIQSVEDAEQLGDKGNVLKVLHQYRDEGIIRHIGFTGHATAEGMKRAAELYDFEVMMIALNHQVPGGEEKFEELPVPFAANKGMGVVAMKVIRPRETVEGLAPSDLVRYALTLEHFNIANIGHDSMEVLKSNLALIKDFKPLDAKKMEEIQLALQPFYRHENLAWMKPSYVDGMAERQFIARSGL
ncbi:MAG: aldo/keto reductase [Bacteroidales bacterium]|nr:aldo/keto reductase [Bacteroidales bacterium]